MANILAISRDNLFNGNQFIGFKEAAARPEIIRAIHKYPQWLERSGAESNLAFKQPIAYTVIINNHGKVFVYQRSKKDENYPEKRLQGKWSWGLGGHIKEIDLGSLSLIRESMKRELKEEIREPIDCKHARLMGFINLEHDVHAVHFGLLYFIEVDKFSLTPNDPEITVGEFRSMDQLEEMILKEDVEEWSKVALEPLRRFCE